MDEFQSPSKSRQRSRLRKLVASLSILLALASAAFIGIGQPALSSGSSDLTPAPTIPICCWPWTCPRVGFPDYAPHGLPDFDMRQDDWQVSSVSAQVAQWTHSGPAAAGDGLWYFDSEAEFLLGRKYPLVTSYGAWPDHDPQNVPPLISDLAGELRTGSQGTSLEDMVTGLDSYFAKQGVGYKFKAFAIKGPTLRWILEEAAVHEIVLVLLGFWQEADGQWVRVGGHWVAANCLDLVDRYILFSDPLLDRAAKGDAGWSYGGPPADATVHNDALYVSHDQYDMVEMPVPGAHWGAAAYAGDELGMAVDNSVGQNSAADLEQYRGGYVEGPAVYVAADYVVLIRKIGVCFEEPTPTPYRIYLPIFMKWHRPPKLIYVPIVMQGHPLPSPCCGQEG